MSSIPAFEVLMGLICLAGLGGVCLWVWNNAQPVLTRTARIVSKRIDYGTAETAATYFVTFEVGAGKCVFLTSRQVHESLDEGAVGTLTSQGTRYQGFVRPHP